MVFNYPICLTFENVRKLFEKLDQEAQNSTDKSAGIEMGKDKLGKECNCLNFKQFVSWVSTIACLSALIYIVQDHVRKYSSHPTVTSGKIEANLSQIFFLSFFLF